jgi:hypothetical protein
MSVAKSAARSTVYLTGVPALVRTDPDHSMPADAASLVRHLRSLLAGGLTRCQLAASSGARHHERHMIFSVDSRAPAAG